MVKKPKKNNIKKLLYIIIILILNCGCVSKKHLTNLDMSKQIKKEEQAYQKKENSNIETTITEIIAYGDTSILKQITPFYIESSQKKNKKNINQPGSKNTLNSIAAITISNKTSKQKITESEENRKNDSIFKEKEILDQRELANEFRRFGGNLPIYFIIISLVICFVGPNLSNILKKIIEYFKIKK